MRRLLVSHRQRKGGDGVTEELSAMNAAQAAWDSCDGSQSESLRALKDFQEICPRSFIAVHGDKTKFRVFVNGHCLTDLFAVDQETAMSLARDYRIETKYIFSLLGRQWLESWIETV
jgi:hypothetical protein